MTDTSAPQPEPAAGTTVPLSPQANEMLRYFKWDHLPERLQPVSAIFWEAACSALAQTQAGPEQTAGLRKLLEAKDCFVRAAL